MTLRIEVAHMGQPPANCLIVPGGLVVAHTHLYSALARGMPPPATTPANFLSILQNVWWRLDRALDAQSIAMSARVGIAEAVASGATCLIDHHESPLCIDGSLDLIADAFQDFGVRGVVTYGITARNFGDAEWRQGLAENRRFLQHNRRPLVRGLVGLHACFTLPDKALRQAAQVARDLGVGLHVHVGEDALDRDALQRLAAADALVPGSVFAHGVHIDPAEVALAAEAGVWWVQNARSNALNAVGFAQLQAAGDRVALGTDGLDGDMLAEGRGLLQHASVAHAPVDVLGRLATGQRIVKGLFGEVADVTVLEYLAPTPMQQTNWTGHLLFGAPTVREVQVDGRTIAIDRSAFYPQAQVIADQLWATMAPLAAVPTADELVRRVAEAHHG